MSSLCPYGFYSGSHVFPRPPKDMLADGFRVNIDWRLMLPGVSVELQLRPFVPFLCLEASLLCPDLPKEC